MGYYSLSVWRGINEYFRKELSSYIVSEFKNPQIRPPYSLEKSKIDSTARIDTRPNYLHEPDSCVAFTSDTINTEITECVTEINSMLAKEQSASNNYESMREKPKTNVISDGSVSDALQNPHRASNDHDFAVTTIKNRSVFIRTNPIEKSDA